MPRTEIRLCGDLAVEIAGRRVEHALPGRQGRLVLAYLVLHRERPVSRDELAEALWAERLPDSHQAALSVVLSRLRKVLPDGVLGGRARLALDLGEDPWVDVEVAARAPAAAQAALARRDPAAALARAREGLAIAAQPLLPGNDGGWLEERRRELADLQPALLEAVARAGLAAGEPAAAEAAAREAIEKEPFRESAHAALMEAHAAAGNVAEALRAYDALRTLLREELGVSPSRPLRELGERLLREEGTQDTEVPLPAAWQRAPATPLVGREDELGRLTAWWEGDARLATLSGEAGIGKTRLARALAVHVHERGGTVLYGRCDEETPLPYQPFVEAIRQLLDHRAVAADQGELARLLPELGAPTPSEDDPQMRRHRLFEAVAAVLEDASARPLLLVLEDLHWADAPTAGLLRHLLRTPRLARLRVLVTFRAGEAPAAGPLRRALGDVEREQPVERIALGGLAEPATGALVEALAPASPGFVHALQAHTAGNAFFIEETLRALAAEGREPTEAELARLGVPDGVRTVIARRIAALGAGVEIVLRTASVAGAEFSVDLLEAVSPGGADPLTALERAAEAGLVVETDRLGTFAFAHAIVRDALAAGMSATRRARVHADVARALERLGAHPAELAHHWHEAGDRDKAFTAALAAADAAVEVSAFAEALRLYRRAIDLREDAELHERAADAARWAADTGTAIEHVRRALALAEPGRAAGLHERLGRYLWEAGDWRAALAAYEDATRLLEHGPPSPVRARVLAAQGAVLMLRERFAEAIAYCLDALAVAREAGARREESHALNTYGVCLAETGRLEDGVEALRGSLAIARELRSLEELCRGYTNLSEVLMRGGRTGEALDVAMEGVRVTAEHGILATGGTIVTANAVAALARLGRWGEAEAVADDALARGVPDGLSAYLRVIRIQLDVARGRLDRARAGLERAREIARDAYEPAVLVDFHAALAELALAEGDREAARRAVADGLEALGAHDDAALGLKLAATGLRAGAPLIDRVRATVRTLTQQDALLAEPAAYAATAEAEHAADDPALWAAAAAAWDALEHPHPAAYARLRRAAAGAQPAEPLLRAAWEAAARLGAEPLRSEVERAAAQLGVPLHRSAGAATVDA